MNLDRMRSSSSEEFISIAEIQLPCIKNLDLQDVEPPCFIYENGTSSYNNIQQLALAVSCNQPVLLQGPVGAGKTCTVEYLAFITGHKQLSSNESANGFVKVQLGEQTDSRMLLGGYQSTEIPGQFLWKPGVLTNAVVCGHWILLEDIDSTSSDVVTVINNLAKSQTLSVPGYGDNIVPHPSFRLFATQRTLGYDSNSAVKCDVLKHWFVIQLKPLGSLELAGIISKKYQSLSTVANKLVSILELDFPTQSSDRIPSARDLLKWCSRCAKYFEIGNFNVSLRVFQDALDIFCGYMDKGSRIMPEQIGFKLGIVKNKAGFLNERYKPNIMISGQKFIAGRCSLDRRQFETAELSRSKNMIFSLNAPSCRLIEKIACCMQNNEPVLLVGETGCGKTTILQYMAQVLGRNLIVINMNQQSDTTDLIGGFKPVTFKWIMKPICDQFEILFRKLFDPAKNRDCLNKFLILYKKQNWNVLLKFIIYVQKRALQRINVKISKYPEGIDNEHRKCLKWKSLLKEWEDLGIMVQKFTKQCEIAEKTLMFSFIEGSLVKAVKQGDWVLLDEINLASSETLDCLSGLLENSHGSLYLLEKGESTPVPRDSGFRLFAAMNPATDVGKKRLPVGLRNRFTEFYIEEPNDSLDLFPLVETYLSDLNMSTEKLRKIVNFYLKIKKNLNSSILDGNGKKPHYSLRNLCRALLVASKNLCGNTSRSLYEGLHLSFLTQLDKTSYKFVHELVSRTVADSDIKAVLNQPIPKPLGKECVNIEGFWIAVGNLEPTIPDNYILTETVKRHLQDVIRIISLGSGIPVLLEGDTSVGKTSLINYLARCTGNFCARVNNHEHTDIQEYIGTYIADSKGKLIFKEGILCEAMRKGYWLILDELNLAPSDVLEALNRVLDDNRELFVPETQTVIKAHEKFMLFATQNPPGLYGGRKELSRAFKNRFIELQFNQIPPNELVTILEKRCHMPLNYCKKMIAVMTDLQLCRRGSDIFIGKSGFITLRDLFRWGERYQKAVSKEKFYDWEQHLADEGYILLAGRVRLPEECKIIEEVIKKHFKRNTSPHNLFSLHENTSQVSKNILETVLAFSKSQTEFKHIVWTFSMRRLAVLVCKAIEFSEPVLLVGETGCGKTTIVQILALLQKRNLLSVNCHTHSESSDFLGGLRPVRESRSQGKLFEWCDGPLVQAMKTGSFFLADEISLADDSVLERLNSLLEPERTILLTEKGGGLTENDNAEYVTVADKNFQFIGTMNPGGDFGKKELSPALRNRFTEIWVEINDKKCEDYYDIINFNLNKPSEPLKSEVCEIMVRFIEWFQNTEYGKRLVVSIRDILTWVEFMNLSNLKWFQSCVHGCYLTFLDGLGCGRAFVGNMEMANKLRKECIEFLTSAINKITPNELHISNTVLERGIFTINENTVGIEPFYIDRGNIGSVEENFVFNSPTTCSNALRLLRGLQMKKAILLEGSPGVGKTSLVAAIAKASGHLLTRINLSDQTDVSDLFGADLPEEGAAAGHFVWRDGPFLTALKEGHWILLDELNLALQSVLEGLNAVLDHRGSVYIPELNKTFHISKNTKLFACQNPLKEGGNRRGLPKSFLNRFTQVSVEPLTAIDYAEILQKSFPILAMLKIHEYFIIDKMIEFNHLLCELIKLGKVGSGGGPWEFNLRDITRWAQGIADDLHCKYSGNLLLLAEDEKSETDELLKRILFKYANLLYFNRFRTKKDVDNVFNLFEKVFGYSYLLDIKPLIFMTKSNVIIGENIMKRNNSYFFGDLNEFEMFVNIDNRFNYEKSIEIRDIANVCGLYRGKRIFEDLRLLEKQYDVLSFLCQSIKMNWLTILVGDHSTGKTSSVRTIAALMGHKLRILPCNSAMDTTEILGGFEQVDYNRHLDDIVEAAKMVILSSAMRLLNDGRFDSTYHLVSKWLAFSKLPVVELSSASINAFNAFTKRLEFLIELLNSKHLGGERDLKKLIAELCGKLLELKNLVSDENCLTSGGKFEWVDSILVKCLKDGSWLLMEDVNLCSNAVLDRLNCLLEPNGTLTIGERGALPDGSLITIKPHPDFRLFFTMNPKNGTISRAMRNRGVEIYLRSDNENVDWSQQDKLALLCDKGIKDVASQKVLMEFESHQGVGNISNLIANGFWMAQYIKHGFEKPDAFRNSTQQVYKIESDEARQLVAELSAKLNSHQIFSISYARPSLNNFLIDPNYAILKQKFAFFVFVSEILKKYRIKAKVYRTDNYLISKEDLEYFFGSGIEFSNLSASDGIKYSIIYIYLTINVDSLKFSVDMLLNATKGLEILVNNELNLLKLSKSLTKTLMEVETNSSELPWDLRWYKELRTLYNEKDEKNKTVLLVKYLFLLNMETKSGLKDLKKFLKTGNESVTVAQYSKAVQDYLLEDTLLEDPVAAKFNIFLERFDELIILFLKHPETNVDSDITKWFLTCMKWRFYFGKLGNEPLLSASRRTIFEDTLTQLKLHLYWFQKYLMEKIKEITLFSLPQMIYEKYVLLGEVLEQILRSETCTKLIKISNVFRHELGQPPPNKYLVDEKYVSNCNMEISEFPSEVANFCGDATIIRTVVNKFIHYFHTLFISRNLNDLNFTHFLSIIATNEILTPVKTLMDQCKENNGKDIQKLSSEIMFHCLRIINIECEFYDDHDEKAYDAYSKQVLLFHRPVWMCRIIHLLFGNPEKWNLGNYKRSGKELSDILVTILPQTSHASNREMDPRANEWIKLSIELSRVRNCLKKCLGLDTNTENFRDSLNSKLKEAMHASEKLFYDKILGTVEALSSLKLTVDSGYDIVGCFWILLGSLELFVLRGSKVDPIRKKLLKAKYLKNEIIELEAEFRTFELNAKITGTCDDHIYMSNLVERLKKAREDLARYRNLEKVERNPEKFTKLCSEVDFFVETFDDIIRFCNNVVGEIFQEDCNTMLLGYFYRKAIYISNKTRHLISTLEKEFLNCFGDLTYPLLAASAQIEHGLNLVMSELLRIPYPKNFGSFLKDLCVFPIPEQKEAQHPFHLLTAVPWHPTAMKCLENDKLLLLFSSCLIKCNEWLIFKNEDKYSDLIAMFSKFVEHWKMEEEKRSEEEAEKDSLYVKKEVTKCATISEEEELNEEQLKLFPTYEKDYEDAKIQQADIESVGHLTTEQLSQITMLHMKIVKEGAEFDWVPDEKTSKISLDFLNPMRMRYLLLSHLLPHISFLLEYNADEWLLPGLLPLIHAKERGYLSHEATLFEEDHKIYDFYKDKNVTEVNKCLEILDGLKERSTELLEQWPEHPALIQINILINRIMSFSIDSPLMKFLTGLELLLQNCQHWESVAHSGVSIADYLVRIVNLIIEWRKLELQGWKTCFQIAHSRIKAAASKRWFHFWCLVEEYLSDDDNSKSACWEPSLNELLELLCKFIETSPIGEFETRLNILLSYHYHIVRLKPSLKRDKLAISCWNLYSFYHQYKSGVARRLESLGAPVYKKLSDYVRIAKWNDITYWSVKQSIEKSHRVLLKFVREYEAILKQQVQLNTIDINDEERITKKKHLFQNINKFLTPLNSSKETSKLIKDSFLINNLGKKLEKLKKFCSDIILTAEYPNLILNVEHLSEQICENCDHFMNLDVDRTLTKEQQKSLAKSIVHQKRRALADLFKTLQRIGLSYKTGLNNTESGIFQLCQMPPMIISEKKSGNKLSGESYYLKAMARKMVLENSLLAPSKEIGPQIIERLRGYTSHIMDLNKEQKFNFCKAQVALKNLRRYEAILTHLIEEEYAIIPDQHLFSQRLCEFINMINETFYIVLQFSIILKAWPSDGENLKKMNFLGNRTPEILISSSQEESYIFVQQKFQKICNEIENLKELCEKLNQDKSAFSIKFADNSIGIDKKNLPLYNLQHVNQFNAYVEEFKNIIKNIQQIRLFFCYENDDNCLVNSLKILEKFSSCSSLQMTYAELDGDEIPFEIIEEKLRPCVENILLTIQKFLKKYKIHNDIMLHDDCKVEDSENDGGEDVEEEEEIEVLQDNHLTMKLIESLKSDLNDLNIERINEYLLSIIEYLYMHSANKRFSILKEKSLGTLETSLIFIKQFTTLCSYFVEQQKMCYRTSNKLSSILTGIFIIIAQKGFCIPPEYEEDGEGTGNQDGGGGGGFGLGDGEGEKDVSDRIESEDQLEGADPKEKEKTEDHDCREEEKGIEMSEDFDGKAQDLDKKGDEDDGTSEEEEEPDVKEMGETEEGAEKLEKELWSSDSEKEGDEEEKSKKEEQGTGKGKQTIEDKYAGKEHDGEEQREHDPSDRKEEVKEDINEVNEQEDTGDQIDPYHGHHQPELEPEPFELSDNINLDEGEGDKPEEENENPFDIDAMKEVQPPNEIEEELKSEKKEENMEQDTDSSDNEDHKEEKNSETEKQNETMDVDNDEYEESINESEMEKKESIPEPEANEEEKNEREKLLEEFEPSDDTPSTQPAQPAPDSEKNELASKDQIVGTSKQLEFESEAQEVTEKPKEESKGTGQAEVENMNEGHEVGASNKEKIQPGQFGSEKEKKRKRERPGKSDENRTLGDDDLTIKKKLKTLDELKDDRESGHDEDEVAESEMYQHIKEKLEKTTQILDAATKEQAESQPAPNKEEEKGEELKKEDEVTMDVDEENLETEEVEEVCPTGGQKLKDSKKQSLKSDEGEPMDEEEDTILKTEGDKIETLTVERGPDSTYHTQSIPLSLENFLPLHDEEVQTLRLQIQEQIAAITQSDFLSHESIQAWQLLNSIVEGLSRDLTEQLRLILEPTKATRLKGDYRTGRRINMRRIIGYIASEFRKDNIWLRRTKPWKRDHEIVLAIDDSSSMADNNSKELAFESLALVSRALGLLEAGELGVLSFGEKTKIVHRLGDPFTDETGARLLQEFTFTQNKTLISEMLDVSSLMMTAGRKKGEVSQLLIIISDGRGVFSEGLEKVKQAVRRTTDQGIFLVFVIIDEPKSKDSIMDIRMPEFKDGKFLGIKSYLEQFPFPYYLILRDISALPRTLSDALRQWFQLITSSSTS